MTAEAWITLAVVVATVVVLAREWLPPSGAMLGAMVAVMATGVVDASEGLSGFSNKAPATIAALYVVARAIEKTGLLSPMVLRLLGDRGGVRASMARLVFPSMLASALLNNTPIVAMLTPQVETWSEQRGWSASKFLMPLSFAAILGGSVTLIGTATNLVVSGLLDASGLEPIGFFEISKVGLPVGLIGAAAVVLLAPGLLPERRSPRDDVRHPSAEYEVDYLVDADGSLADRTVADAGLRNLRGVYLAQLVRAGEVLSPVAPETRLRGGDRLRFVGLPSDVVELNAMAGLRPAVQEQIDQLGGGRSAYFEVVIGAGSGLAGKTLRELEFRSRYQAAVLAIHRAGERVAAQLGRERLRVGDSLILAADPRFQERWQDRSDFLLVAPLEGGVRDTRSMWRVGAVLAVIVGLAVGFGVELLTAVLLAAVGMVVVGAITPGEAQRAVNLDVIVTIAAAFGLAAAISNSGLADTIAGWTVDAFGGFGGAGVLLGLVVATTVLKELITTNAAALLMFPIAVSSAITVGADPRGYAIAIAIAASKSFLTPIGYQTNTMVYGPGGYRYFDYMRLGLPLTFVVIALIMLLVPLYWPG